MGCKKVLVKCFFENILLWIIGNKFKLDFCVYSMGIMVIECIGIFLIFLIEWYVYIL